MFLLLTVQAAWATDLVIMVPGLGDSAKGRRNMARWGEQTPGYEVRVPHYIARESVAQTTANLGEWLEGQDLAAFEQVHVFSYIMGTWALNLYLQEHSIPNLASVVYDRSPIQERAPSIIHDKMRCLTRLLFGPVVGDLAGIPYPDFVAPEGVRTGIIVENRATPLMRTFRGASDDMGPVSWEVADLNHSPDDAIYTWVNHDEMYESFETIGPELLSFFETGRFSEGAARVPSELDPWRRTP